MNERLNEKLNERLIEWMSGRTTNKVTLPLWIKTNNFTKWKGKEEHDVKGEGKRRQGKGKWGKGKGEG